MPRQRDPGRRDELEASLVDHVLAHGLADLSLRGVAAALGISTYPLAYHFGSKEGVVATALAGAEERQRAMVAEWAAEPGGDLADLLRRYWAWASRDEALPFFRLFFEVAGLALRRPERFPGFLGRAWQPWLDLLRDLARQRGLSDEDATAAAALAASVASGAMLGLLATGDRAMAQRTINLAADHLAAMFPVSGNQNR